MTLSREAWRRVILEYCYRKLVCESIIGDVSMRALSALGVGVIVITGCASQRPVLYPNEHIRRVGSIVADRDIDDCIRRAEESRSAGDAKAAGEAGTDASARVPSSPAATISGLFGKPELSSIQKVFVNKCLRDKGYDPIGWN
jgi:outer membrane lipoprotein SlyB